MSLRIVLCLLILAGWPTARAADGGDRDWPVNGRTLSETHFSPLAQIKPSNVQGLGLAWEFDGFVVRGRTHRGVESSPLVANGVMYFSGPWSVVYALDARTGRLLWKYDPEVPGQWARTACCDVVNRGVALWDGRVYVASLDGYLIALDAKSGKPEWRVDTFVDRATMNYSSTGAPRIAGGNVVIGNGGAEMGARGYVSAYDLKSGKLSWRFYTVPGDPKKGPDESAGHHAGAAQLEQGIALGSRRRRNGVGLHGLRSGLRTLVHRRRQRHAASGMDAQSRGRR